MKKISLKILAVILFSTFCLVKTYSQSGGVSINPNNAGPDPSAILDVNSNSKGALIPRMTTSERNAITSPANSLQIFNTDNNCLQMYVAGAWQNLWCPGAGCSPDQPSAITGTSPVCQSQSGVSYSVSNVTGVTYSWSYSGSGFTCTSGCTTNSITASFSSGATSGTLTCTPSNGCGIGASRTLAITVNAPPTTANAGPNQLNVSGASTTLAGNTPTSGTGLWTIVSGTGGNIANPSSPTSNFTGTMGTTYILAWTISNPPCTASSSQVTISFASCNIGVSMGGGITFYSGGGKCYVAATSDQGNSISWGCQGTLVGASGTAIGTGKSNTDAIVAGCTTSGIAAQVCKSYNGGGFTDWFLPSKDEQMEMYNHLAQIGGFTTNYYWNSSEYDSNSAWGQNMYGGGATGANNKSVAIFPIRCIRSF